MFICMWARRGRETNKNYKCREPFVIQSHLRRHLSQADTIINASGHVLSNSVEWKSQAFRKLWPPWLPSCFSSTDASTKPLPMVN